MESLAAVIASAMREVLKSRDQRIATLEQRLALVEQNAKGFRYRGVWKAGEMYQPNDFATRDGSLWHCGMATDTQPGKSEDWVLCVKRGRDARIKP